MSSSPIYYNGSHDSDKGDSARVENSEVAASRAGFGQKAKRHCAKWWWVHLIIFCISFLIIALCLTYVGMPRIAQHGVDESWLEMTDIQFLDPTPDQVTLTQKAILHSPSIFTPTLDPFNATLWLVTNGTFASEAMNVLEMPRIHAMHPKSNASVIGQTVNILSLDQITEYATQVLTEKNVSTALTGKTILHEGKLPTVNINYNTTAHYAGLNGLAGFDATDARVNTSVAAGQPNLKGNAFIPNPSVLTVAMGNVTLSLSTLKDGVTTLDGNATVLDFIIRPGNNSLPMTSIVDQPKVLAAMDSDGFVNLVIAGTSAVYNGQHITYYEKALASNVLNLKMNIKQVVLDSVSS